MLLLQVAGTLQAGMPAAARFKKPSSGALSDGAPLLAHMSPQVSELLELGVRVAGREFTAVIDSGASDCFMSRRVV